MKRFSVQKVGRCFYPFLRFAVLLMFLSRVTAQQSNVGAIYTLKPNPNTSRNNYNADTLRDQVGQSLPSKKEAAMIMRNAFATMDVRELSRTPFRLVAKVHYEVAGRAEDGIYELLQEAPDHFRENFKMGAIEESDVAFGDKLYIIRNTPFLTLPLWRVRQLVNSPVPPSLRTKPKAWKVYSAQIAGVSTTCTRAADNDDWIVGQVCFEPSTNGMVTLDLSTNYQSEMIPSIPPSLTLEIHLSEFSSSQDIGRFPRHLVYREFGENVDVKIETIDRILKFDENVLAPPGVEPSEWCSTPTQKGSQPTLDFVPILSAKKGNVLTAYYLFIGRDGRVKKSVPVPLEGAGADERTMSRLRDAHFPISYCGEKSIEYETYFIFLSRSSGFKTIIRP
jgi:hypothetical protein